MEYLVKYDFNTISKGGMISGMSGESEITSAQSKDVLKKSDELIQLIANDMATKTKKSILSVNITDISEIIKPKKKNARI